METEEKIIKNETRRILVYGSSGCGKTSMINLLTGENAPVNVGKLEGCTFENKDYPVKRNSVNYLFTDTAGLNEAQGGMVEHKQAIKQLIKLIRKAKAGFHLLIHVRKCETLKNDDFQNYNLIVNKLFQSNVKCICINTRAETATNMNEFWEKNEESFEKRGMKFEYGLSVCCKQTAENPLFAEGFKKMSEISRENIWNLVEKFEYKETYIQKDSIWLILNRIWNSYIDYLKGITKLKFLGFFKFDSEHGLRKALKEIYKFSDKDCDEIIKEIE